MLLFSTLALSIFRTFACDGLDINSFVTWYDCTFVTPYILGESHYVTIFLFHPWQICHTTKEEHFLLAPVLHFFLHQPNVPTKLKPSFTMAITTSTPKELCIIQTLLLKTDVNFLTLVLSSFGQHISLAINKSFQ